MTTQNSNEIPINESPSLASNSGFNTISAFSSSEDILKHTKYTFNLTLDVLINNSTTSRLAVRNKKKNLNRIPRRQNPWIIYRRDKSASPEFKGLKSALISKKISEMWAKESKETIALFEVLAKMSEDIHKEKYTDYEYRPQKKKQGKVQEKKEQKPPCKISNICVHEPEELEQQVLPDMSTPSLSEESPQFLPTPDIFETNMFNPTPLPEDNVFETTTTSPSELPLFLPTPALSPLEMSNIFNISPLLEETTSSTVFPPSPASSHNEANIFIPTSPLPETYDGANFFIPNLITSIPEDPILNLISEIDFFSKEPEDLWLQKEQQQQQHQQQQQQYQQQPDWLLYDEQSSDHISQ